MFSLQKRPFSSILQQKWQTVRQKPLFTESLWLLISMTLVNAGNYLFNLILGRWLGPAAFADLSLIVTAMLAVTFITVTFQLTAVKFTATYIATNEIVKLHAFRVWCIRLALIFGFTVMLLLVLGSGFWQQFFQTESIWPFIILGVGIPVYFVLGVDRGIQQGQTAFRQLAISYQVEMWVRLLGGVLFVYLGWGVNGAVVAITLSFFASWYVVKSPTVQVQTSILTRENRQAILAFSAPVVGLHVSQILINNSDVFIVKRFFEAEVAGHYAALALMGRIVFFATWSVVTLFLPLVTQKFARQEPHRHLLWGALAAVGGISLCLIMFAKFWPDFIVLSLFGSAYASIAPMLWLYAVATSLYAVANVIVNYYLAINQYMATYLAVLVGFCQVACLTIWHESIHQVLWVQIALMSGFVISLLLLLVWPSPAKKMVSYSI